MKCIWLMPQKRRFNNIDSSCVLYEKLTEVQYLTGFFRFKEHSHAFISPAYKEETKAKLSAAILYVQLKIRIMEFFLSRSFTGVKSSPGIVYNYTYFTYIYMAYTTNPNNQQYRSRRF